MSAPEKQSPVPPSPAAMPRWMPAAGGFALAIAATGAPLAVGRFDLAVLLPLVAAFSLAFALVQWLRKDDPRAEAVSRARGALGRYGGGFYGTAALATWVYLGVVTIRQEWAASRGMRDFLFDRLMEWLPRFGVDSLHNTIRAAAWPLFWGERYGWGAMLAGGAVAWVGYRLALRLAARRPAPDLATADEGVPAVLRPGS